MAGRVTPFPRRGPMGECLMAPSGAFLLSLPSASLDLQRCSPPLPYTASAWGRLLSRQSTWQMLKAVARPPPFPPLTYVL
jgi:hypothetical protein